VNVEKNYQHVIELKGFLDEIHKDVEISKSKGEKLTRSVEIRLL
jgi:hypothetical protein